MLTEGFKAIETSYAGCRFRSRLEARWAVFFDAMGIEWNYELEPVEVRHRLSWGEGRWIYLPDFWLPKLEIWAEVKGQLNDDDFLRFLNAAASLSSNNGGGCHDSGGNDVVLLGTPYCRPETGQYRRPWRLHMHKGGLYAAPWDPDEVGTGCPLSYWKAAWEVAADYGGDLAAITSGCEREDSKDCLLAGSVEIFDATIQADYFCRALVAARSARFEHGESG